MALTEISTSLQTCWLVLMGLLLPVLVHLVLMGLTSLTLFMRLVRTYPDIWSHQSHDGGDGEKDLVQ